MSTEPLAAALEAVASHGLLLLQDGVRPSLASMIAGEPVRGSWWSHPAGKVIFATAAALDDAEDVITAKLVDGKITFVHRRLWPALVVVGRARAPWQMDRLPAASIELLARVDEEGSLQCTGAAAKTLEQRLLVASAQVHTDSGAHALELSTWDRFATAHAIAPPWLSLAEARATLEQTLARLPGATTSPPARLPWQAITKAR